MSARGAWLVAAAALVAGCSSLATTPAGSDASGGATPAGAAGAEADRAGVAASDGGLGEAPAAAVTGISCPDFKGCEGSLVGTWDGEAACTDGLFSWFDAPPTSGCADFKETKVTGSVKVRYEFTEVNVKRSLEGTIVETIDLPLGCTRAATCAAVQDNVVKALYGERANPYPNASQFSASCTEPTKGVCRCDVTLTLSHELHDWKQGYELQSESYLRQADGTDVLVCPKGDTLTLATTVQGLGGIFPDGITYTLRKVK